MCGQTPEGYMQNAQGHLVPVDQIREIDKARDELVQEKVAKVKQMQWALRDLKLELLGDIGAFVQLSAERYGAKIGGDKGNVTLQTFDGKYQIRRQLSENMTFDEGLQAAKALIDECLREWCDQSPGELKAIVEQAFRVDKEGRINTSSVLTLRRLNITDPRWQKAMQAISDSLQVADTRTYVRVYERDTHGKYNAISLDMAAL